MIQMLDTGSYDLLEDNIIERLSVLIGLGVDVVAEPDNDRAYKEAFEKPKLTVMFIGSEYSSDTRAAGLPKNFSTSGVMQEEYAKVSVIFECKTKRGDLGIYSLKRKVDKLLLGYKPQPFNKIFFNSFEKISHSENVWTFALVFTTTRPFFETESVESDLINSNNLSLQAIGSGIASTRIELKENC